MATDTWSNFRREENSALLWLHHHYQAQGQEQEVSKSESHLEEGTLPTMLRNWCKVPASSPFFQCISPFFLLPSQSPGKKFCVPISSLPHPLPPVTCILILRQIITKYFTGPCYGSATKESCLRTAIPRVLMLEGGVAFRMLGH